ncbi:MAG: hypothetical protein HY584_05820 [Candidatus Omnitrophica bacterium]|nr:hypothetical protein [Candidatus Omnitrophota bacterium]
MWKDTVRERYWWAQIQSQLDELIYELSKAEEEEAALFYLLGLHLSDLSDLKFFSEREQIKIRGLLTELMNYSNQHLTILSKVLEELKAQKEHDARSAV